ncbi:sensor histidine kinase [Psychromarinibacter sp. C21-152]|uniref:histidine kinase n=1 Tax=Psychromarinibacter sediminicola TaxID=3033385 RepID=A0AAE3NTU2_9RHOB|nr:sensor histidine kinase [Psychromarinibacter sediminicola]MDF0600810.1 sensor histidine kinase [Psychromarinibacter sediminicola]
MNAASDIDVNESQRAADADLDDLVLGEDWVRPESEVGDDVRERRRRRGFISINRSPLARKIITFNLLAMLMLVAGVLYLNPVRDNLVLQREAELVAAAHLVADVFEAQLPEGAARELGAGAQPDVPATLAGLRLASGIDVYVYAPDGSLIADTVGQTRPPIDGLPDMSDARGSTVLTDSLNWVWEALSGLFHANDEDIAAQDIETTLRTMAVRAATGGTEVQSDIYRNGGTIFSVATPVLQGGDAVGVVALSSPAGEIDELVRSEREQVLQMFVIAILVSIGLSLVLASTIANPLSDLAAAAEIGRDRSATRRKSPARVRIPDLSGRPDEIGRLSAALRGMVGALYERIDANEQFASDVAHEIKNPLASLRSAIGTLRVAKREDQRERLLEVIEHDVRRLDRLVSDISNASRLDSELVKEDEENFDLLAMLRNLTDYLGNEAREKGIEFITDMPTDPIQIHGLEARLAQVFVNLISNAISFCEDGDAIRVWVRRRENRVLVVVEDTGPGIPEEALTKIFNRFYSERPAGQFGNNSGLGLAISKQIVEAHSGVIWAENIRPTDADVTSDPLGARFVVGLPV